MQIEKSMLVEIVLDNILKMVPALEIRDLIAIFGLDAAIAVDLLTSLACALSLLHC